VSVLLNAFFILFRGLLHFLLLRFRFLDLRFFFWGLFFLRFLSVLLASFCLFLLLFFLFLALLFRNKRVSELLLELDFVGLILLGAHLGSGVFLLLDHNLLFLEVALSIVIVENLEG